MNQWLKIFLSDKYVPVTVPERPPKEAQPKAVSAPKPKPPLPPPVYHEPVYEPPPPVKKAPEPERVERHVPRSHAVEAPVEYDDDYVPPARKPKPVSLPGEVEIPEYRPSVMAEAAEPDVLDELEAALGPSVPEPPATAVPDDGVKDDFETVMDSLMKDLGDEDEDGPLPFGAASRPAGKPLPASRAPVPMPPLPKKPVKTGMDGGYEQVKLPVGLMDEEEAPAPQGPIDSLSDLCDRARAATSEDYLILTAYFLTYFEGVEKFSLKKVNSMLVKSGLTPVNHSVLESGLSNGHVAMVQDTTGTADVSEYTMTEHGKDYASSLL